MPRESDGKNIRRNPMKRIVSSILVCVLLLGVVCAFSSCSNVSAAYAEKVQKAADSNEHFTLAQVKEDLGDEAIELTVLGNGVVIAVKGCTSVEEIQAKLESGENVEGIIIGIALNKAVSAAYEKITEDDLK